MADPLIKRAAPQFIRQSLALATPEDRAGNLLEIYRLLESDEQEVLFRAVVERLVSEPDPLPEGRTRNQPFGR